VPARREVSDGGADRRGHDGAVKGRGRRRHDKSDREGVPWGRTGGGAQGR
jgi:hypothetical protein